MTLLTFVGCSVLWTGLLAGLTELLTRRNMTAYAAQALWRICAVLMVVPWLVSAVALGWPESIPTFSVPIPWPDMPDFAATGATNEAATGTLSLVEDTAISDWITPLVSALLIAGWIARAMAGAASHLWLNRLQRQSAPLTDHDVRRAVADAAKAVGLATPPNLRHLETNHSPFVSGLTQPTLYMSTSSLAQSGRTEVLIHECVHIARGDLVTRPLERLVADIIWFSPFAWIARRRLDDWREAVCDAASVRLTGDPSGYARALIETARACQPTALMPVAALFSNPKRTLTMRINALIAPPDSAKSWNRFAGGLGLLAITAPLAFAQNIADQAGSPPNETVFAAAIIDHPDAKITSSFGERTHPITRKLAFHSGTDIGAPFGTKILIPAAGEVITTGERRGYGLIVEVELDGSKDRLRFAQLRSYSVKVGDRLTAGDSIGEVGASGRATGPHLHIEYLDRSNGNQASNPETIEGLELIAGE
ncbi:MAG: M23/M56 family metallopeptidase [Pseudomonadota bacterium]